MSEQPRYTKTQMIQETARINWSELEQHYVRGVVIHVGNELDLVAVATSFVNDEKTQVEIWITGGEIEPLAVETAKNWSSRDADLWAVVAAPWVLVQEKSK
jgi:hypothetical protein